MKWAAILSFLALANLASAEVKRVTWLERVKGLEYVDSAGLLEWEQKNSISILDLVQEEPPTKGVAYLVRVIEWESKNDVRTIWSYRLNFKNGKYEFQRLGSSREKVDINKNHTVVYYTRPAAGVR